MTPNHKYRVSVYLGKDMYNEYAKMAKLMGISISTLVKIMLNTGTEIARQIERGLENGGK